MKEEDSVDSDIKASPPGQGTHEKTKYTLCEHKVGAKVSLVLFESLQHFELPHGPRSVL